MKITKERTRLIFEEYTKEEKTKIEDIVATVDKVLFYEDPDRDFICIPTGMIDKVRKVFPSVHVDDKSAEYWPYETIHPVKHSAQPRNELQVDFINYLVEHAKLGQKVGGILSPGTGKTFMACYSAIKMGQRTLFIAPTQGVKKQWGETLINMFGVDPSRVLVVDKPSDFINVKADFVVISQPSLASLNKSYHLDDIMKANKFGIKVIDEVQMWFHNIIKVDGNSNIKNNWYLTGTFGRSGEEENELFQEMFSDLHVFREKNKTPTIFNRKPGNIYGMKPYMEITMVWAHSGITPEQRKAVMNSIRYSERAEKWMRYGINIAPYTKIVIPPDGRMTPFLSVILKTIQHAEKQVKYGKTLILGTLTYSIEIVAEYVKKMFPGRKIGIIHGGLPKEQNDRTKKECDMLLSTVASAGTGFDVKGLSKLITFSQYKSWINLSPTQISLIAGNSR